MLFNHNHDHQVKQEAPLSCFRRSPADRDWWHNISEIINTNSDDVYKLQKHVYNPQKREDKLQKREVVN